MEPTDCLQAYYSEGREDGRLRSRHGSVEFLTTVRYVERYLQPGMRLLEIGAGTGRYSHFFAQKGYAVDAVELLDCNIRLFRQNTVPGEPVTITRGNALDLSDFADDTYDITLLLGPMYHLYTEKEQHRALAEAIRVTKPGGILFAAYCNNDATLVQFCFVRGNLLPRMEQGSIDPVTFHCRSAPEDVFQLYTKADVDRLMAPFPVTRLHYLGTDMATLFIRDTVDAMDDATFALYLQYHFSICERPDLVGATHHMLDIFRKDSNAGTSTPELL